MEFMNNLLPIILYIVLTILIVVLIVLAIRLIKTVEKVDKVVDDVNRKMDKLDGVFTIMDKTADAVSLMSDKLVAAIMHGITSLFKARKKNKKEKENGEDE